MMIQTKTGALLHREHVATIQGLQSLEQFLVRQTSKRPPDTKDETVRAILGELTAMVEKEVGRHFGFEEQHLFPLLAERGEGGIGAFLMTEHEAILPLARDVAAMAAQALAEGFSAETWKSFHAIGLELVEREIFHIQKEEMGLLAAISMLVDAEDDARLAEIYEDFITQK